MTTTTRPLRSVTVAALCLLPVIAAACAGSASSDTGSSVASGSVTAVPNGKGRSGSTHQSNTTTTTPSGPTTTLPFGVTNVKGYTVLRQQGYGNGATSSFTIPHGTPRWDVTWFYSCGATAQTTPYLNLGYFVFEVYKNGSINRKDPGAGGPNLNGQGTQSYSDTGVFSLKVGTQPACTWELIVVVPSH